MPKLGMEPIRRDALVRAAITEVGEAGSLDVTVSAIAQRAGMSSGLAHHYFGGKDQMFLAAMRQILRDYSGEVRTALAAAPSSKDRLAAVIGANFAATCFEPQTISAWLTFYVQAQNNSDAARLLALYQRRLHSNLTHALRAQTGDAVDIAATLAALIDGVYLRAALTGLGFEKSAPSQVLDTANALIAQSNPPKASPANV